jgi:signal peptidase I
LWLVGLLLMAGALSFWAFKASAISVRVYTVPSGSMGPAIKAGDKVCVESYSTSKPKRGEIWALQMPNPKGVAIKRVIGLPGETIDIRSGQVYIDGRALAEPYLTAPFTYSLAPVKLGPSEYFTLGDCRDASNDSHIWGPLRDDSLVGRVKYRYWPPARVSGF